MVIPSRHVTYPQGKYEEADLFCLRAIGIEEKRLGVDHPLLVPCLTNRVQLLDALVSHVRVGARVLNAVDWLFSTTGYTLPHLCS